MTDFGPSRCFTKLVGAGAALATLMLATPASARQWWVMEGAAPVETLHAAQTGPLPTRCVVGNGLNTSPAFLYERMKDLGDTAAHIGEKRHSETQVYYLDQQHPQTRLRPFLPHERGL